ncbi:MAG: hypothetical protein GY821_03670 [Gammaproteobacteria bacterium]|nr:hypothetical protein [Gammaproteobacteria bacterium]
MAQPFHIHLANALRHANRVADHQIIRSNQLPRIERERLLKGNWLEQIIRGWYLLRPPHVAPGESTPWYANFWHFIKLYLGARFGSDYCLSPESSLEQSI